jgi:Family of unknown function (DUF6338)
MEGFGFETLLVLILLLPGFLASAILDALTIRKERTQLEKVIEALVFSLVVYAFWSWIVVRQPLQIEIEQINEKTTRYSLSIGPSGPLWLFVFGVLIGLTMSFLITNDLPTRLLRPLRITRASTRATVWDDVLSSIDKYVVVEFSDGRRIMGWPRFFSDTPREGSLFLQDAAWVLDDGTTVNISGPGILITKNMIVSNVIFLDVQSRR